MRRTSRLRAFSAMCFLLLCSHATARAAQYEASLIPTAPSEILASADGISNSGIVLGTYGGANNTGYFLWTATGGRTDIDTAVFYRGGPNVVGEIVGEDESSAVVRDLTGTVRQLGLLNPSDLAAGAYAASDSGLAIGYSRDASSSYIVTWDLATGGVTQIAQGENGELGGWLGSAAISSTGYTAWTYITNRQYPDGHTAAIPRSFRRDPSGDIVELSAGAGTNWFVQNVADDGAVLVGGWVWNMDGTLTRGGLDEVAAMSGNGLLLGTLASHQVVLGLDGSLSDLPLPVGAISFRALGINDQGAVVGWAAYADGNRAVVWEPVPEPPVLLGLASGLGWLVVAMRRRRL